MALPLLVRFPQLRAPSISYPVISPENRAASAALADDFEVLDRHVKGDFETCDVAALRHQNRYRRQQVIVLLGSALVTGLGGLQAIFPAQRWPGLLLTLLGVVLASSSRWAGERASLAEYLTERVKAERLRALHFRYLSRTGRFAGGDREIQLQRAVLAIRAGKEPA